MSTPTNHKRGKQGFEGLFNPRSENAEIKHDALMLMAGFLSEIEAVQDKQKISRKELAKKIDTSGSYLTQVFRSKKPLNFITLAKIKKALGIRFEINAFVEDGYNVPTPSIKEYCIVIKTSANDYGYSDTKEENKFLVLENKAAGTESLHSTANNYNTPSWMLS